MLTNLKCEESNEVKTMNRKYTYDKGNGQKYCLIRFDVWCTERAPDRESEG